jgi:hypothetical protein
MNKIEILVPVAEVSFGEIKMAGRTKDLNGKVIGLMWNHKPNGDLLLRHLEEALSRKFELSGVLMKEKPLASSGAPPEVLEELSARCDFVILAIGD